MTAITCIRDVYLRTVCTLLLRQHGFEVIDSFDIRAAEQDAKRSRPQLMVVGKLADPYETLQNWAVSNGLECIAVAPNEPVRQMAERIMVTAAAVTSNRKLILP